MVWKLLRNWFISCTLSDFGVQILLFSFDVHMESNYFVPDIVCLLSFIFVRLVEIVNYVNMLKNHVFVFTDFFLHFLFFNFNYFCCLLFYSFRLLWVYLAHFFPRFFIRSLIFGFWLLFFLNMYFWCYKFLPHYYFSNVPQILICLFSFSFNSMYFKIYLVTSLSHGLFRSLLSKLEIFLLSFHYWFLVLFLSGQGTPCLI